MKKWILALLIALVASFSMNAEVIKLVGNAFSVCDEYGQWSDWNSGRVTFTLNTSNDVIKMSYDGSSETLQCYESSDWEESGYNIYESTMYCVNKNTGEATEVTLQINDGDLLVYITTDEVSIAINIPDGGVIRNYKSHKRSSKKSSKKKRRR